MSTVFISHASADAALAQAIEQLLRAVTDGAVSVRNSSSTDSAARIPMGSDWMAWIHEQVKTADATIVALTPRSVANRWVLWETGAIWGAATSSGKGRILLPVCIGIQMSEIPDPLKPIQAADISSEDGAHQFLLRLITETLQGNMQQNSLVRLGQGKGLSEYLDVVKRYNIRRATLFDQAESLRSLLESRQLQQALDTPLPTLAMAYSQYLERVTERIHSWQDRPLVVPSAEYPYYLIRLQEALKVRVDAVAFVDDVERFWARRLGHQIMESSERGRTRRVFVLRNEHDLREYTFVLSEHSRKYDVRVLSVEEIRAKHSDFARDFSILSTSETDRVLARYVSDRHDIGIAFTADRADINLHSNAFEHIWASALEVPNPLHCEILSEALFATPRVEMSRYIEVEKYDLHEEKHPYFIEMMAMMIQLCKELRSSGFIKVLEMDAGTGHLTKRLVETLGASGRITAIEYDSNCYRFMIGKRELWRSSQCEVIHADSRRYDPPGKFDIILSSFADHHIVRSEDEADQYFSNIRRNLHAYASFVVGDEFLPEHDPGDERARASAIRAYHGHILDEARATREHAPELDRNGYDILMELETEAMESGLREGGGDFKISLRHYLQRLERNGLSYDEPIAIGPEDENLRNRVGGIYVIRAYVKA